MDQKVILCFYQGQSVQNKRNDCIVVWEYYNGKLYWEVDMRLCATWYDEDR